MSGSEMLENGDTEDLGSGTLISILYADCDSRGERWPSSVADQAAFATHDARWTANIGELAAFLAGANPNWPEKDVLDLLALHLIPIG